MRSILLAASVICGLILPVAVVCTVVTNLVFDASFYHEGQANYQVWRTTGLSTAALDRVNEGIVRFFGDDEPLPTALGNEGAPPTVFNQREILHMDDVRSLIRGIGAAGRIGLLYVGGFLLVSVAMWQRGGRDALARAMILSSLITLVVGGLTAIITYFGFDSLFLWFHRISFHNDFWQLDPRTDRLIQMFPFGFWFDAMLVVTFRVLLVMIVLGSGGLILRRGASRRVPATPHETAS